MSAPPYFKLYAREFHLETLTLSAVALGAHIRALTWCWSTGLPLPIDESDRRKVMGLEGREWVKVWPKLLPFWTETCDGFVNSEIQHQQQEFADKSAKLAENGRKGGRPAMPMKSKSFPKRKAEKSHTDTDTDTDTEDQNLPPSPQRGASGGDPPGPSPDDLVAVWNRITTAPLPKVTKLTPERRRKAVARLSESPDLAWWERVVTRLNGIDFCRGHGAQKWIATFDWLVRNADNAVRIDEGAWSSQQAASKTVEFESPRIPSYEETMARLAEKNAWFDEAKQRLQPGLYAMLSAEDDRDGGPEL